MLTTVDPVSGAATVPLVASVTREETNEHKTANHCDWFSDGEFINLRLRIRADTYAYTNAYTLSNSNQYADADSNSNEHADADRDAHSTAAVGRTLCGQAD